MKGSYILVLIVPEQVSLTIGALGKITFPKGYYAYIGSAMNSLEKRIHRHLSKKKKLHWHIDYLLKCAKVDRVLIRVSTKREECFLAKHVSLKGTPVPGFGCSDCHCDSHLFRIKNPQSLFHLGKIYYSNG